MANGKFLMDKAVPVGHITGPHYRATLVVEYLGWVDLDLGSSPSGGPLL